MIMPMCKFHSWQKHSKGKVQLNSRLFQVLPLRRRHRGSDVLPCEVPLLLRPRRHQPLLVWIHVYLATLIFHKVSLLVSPIALRTLSTYSSFPVLNLVKPPSLTPSPSKITAKSLSRWSVAGITFMVAVAHTFSRLILSVVVSLFCFCPKVRILLANFHK